jgi:preprotein translocase subunit SecA
MHKQEAQIVEEAGKAGVVTIATNMAVVEQILS